RGFYEKQFPELLKGLRTPRLLPLPASDRVLTLNAWPEESLQIALNPFLEHLRAISDDPEGPRLVIGLDAEWSLNGNNQKEGKVRLLQLAFSQKLRGDARATDYNINELRSISSPDVVDLASLAKAKGVIEDARKGSLKELTRKVLDCDLDKSLWKSDWSRELSKEQLLYASRDAWASLMIYQTLIAMPSPDFSCSTNARENGGGSALAMVLLRRREDEDLSIASEIDRNWDGSLSEQNSSPDEGIVSPVISNTSEYAESPAGTPNGPVSRVLLDILHAMKRLEVSRLHPASPLFHCAIRDAIFEFVGTHKDAVSRFLQTEHNITFEEKFKREPQWILKRVPRWVPSPTILAERLKKVFGQFSRPSYNDSDGQPLVTDKLKKEFKNLMKHVKEGCLSDPIDVPLYRKVGEDKNKLPLFVCFRGTNDVESLHQSLEMLFNSFNAGVDLIDASLACIRHVFNVGASERNRPNFPKLGHCDHFLIDQINDVTARLH
ncbi:hypothetical protein HDU67_002572, partial [Dinochytrium kinnereticum]